MSAGESTVPGPPTIPPVLTPPPIPPPAGTTPTIPPPAPPSPPPIPPPATGPPTVPAPTPGAPIEQTDPAGAVPPPFTPTSDRGQRRRRSDPTSSARRNQRLSIVGLVVGIIGLLLFWAFGVGALLGGAAVLLSALGLTLGEQRIRRRTRKVAIVGIVTGLLAVALGSGFIVPFGVPFDLTRTDAGRKIQDNTDRAFREGINTEAPDRYCDPVQFLQDPDC